MDYYDTEGILLEIKNKLQEEFDNSSCYKEIYVSDINTEFIELRNKVDNVVVNIIFNELFLLYGIENNSLECYIKILKRLKYSSYDFFLQLSYGKLYYDKKNKPLEIWYNKLSSYEDRKIIGFYNKRSKIAEFIMEESRHIPVYENGEVIERMFLLEFYISNVKIRISRPSPIFKLLFKVYINCDHIGWWEYFETINIHEVNRNKLNKYLQQALFINNIYNKVEGETILKFGVESQLRHYPNDYEYDSVNINVKFPESNYEKPLAFYNQAVNGTDEVAFLYYYKVLEFFFYISKKDNNIEHKSEINCLERVLTELNIDNEVKYIIENEFFNYMLEDDDKNNVDCNNMNIKIFTNKLYKYRNSVAHGKDDTNLLSHVPMNLIDNEEKRKLDGWNSIGEKLAYICIKYFCFDDFELF